MPDLYGFTPTNAGRGLIASLLAGETLTITRAMVGSGKPDSLAAMAALTDLVAPVAQATSTTPVRTEDAISLTVEYRSDMNGGLQEGFAINEYGLFAKTDESAETLIFYGCLGDHPQWVYPYSPGVAPDVRDYPVTIQISSEVNVQISFHADAFITAEPSVSGFNLTGAKGVEAGTRLASASYTAATLSPGSYQYGPETGVTATNWKVERITDQATQQVASADAASLSSGSDNNGGPGFIIGDMGGENVVASLKYRATATHGAGVTAHDNLGGDSDPAVAIAAGTKTKETAAYTPFRNVFYGASTDKPELNSAAIRALTPTGKAYAAGTLTINVPAGAQRVVIACIEGKAGVKQVINQTAMNADVTSTFVKSVVPVEGASGYTAQDYNVWVFEPAVPYENPATLQVTLG